jgi:phosphatidate phosphatase APP1
MNKPRTRARYTNNAIENIIHLLRLFQVKPIGGVTVSMVWAGQHLQSVSEKDGFFKFEWKSETHVTAGWHQVSVNITDENGQVLSTGEGKIFVPHITQYAFISDIDDTVLVSHSATIGKRLKVLFTKNPRTRKAFRDVVTHYGLLARAATTVDVPNPFFYVSSSEWNLYDDLVDFFNYNKLPEGTFLLNQIKQVSQLLKTGKTKHEGKLIRVMRILDAFPNQRFVLLGDNSQKDPAIYSSIAQKYPEKIYAIYIRNIVPRNESDTRKLFSGLGEKGVHTCLFKDNTEAIAHSKSIGLIEG